MSDSISEARFLATFRFEDGAPVTLKPAQRLVNAFLELREQPLVTPLGLVAGAGTDTQKFPARHTLWITIAGEVDGGATILFYNDETGYEKQLLFEKSRSIESTVELLETVANEFAERVGLLENQESLLLTEIQRRFEVIASKLDDLRSNDRYLRETLALRDEEIFELKGRLEALSKLCSSQSRELQEKRAQRSLLALVTFTLGAFLNIGQGLVVNELDERYQPLRGVFDYVDATLDLVDGIEG